MKTENVWKKQQQQQKTNQTSPAVAGVKETQNL